MKLTTEQLKQLIKEEMSAQTTLLTESGHSAAKKKFEKAAGAYLKSLLADGWSRFDAVQELVSQLRVVFKTIHVKGGEKDEDEKSDD